LVAARTDLSFTGHFSCALLTSRIQRVSKARECWDDDEDGDDEVPVAGDCDSAKEGSDVARARRKLEYCSQPPQHISKRGLTK